MEPKDGVQYRQEQLAFASPEGDGTDADLTILHCGDVFLDGPVHYLRLDKRERRREELRETFAAFLSRADAEKADLVIISGNFLDGTYAGDSTLAFLVKEFEARPSCYFLITPGPVDAYNGDSIYTSKRWPRNVHVFSEEVLGTYHFHNLPLTVYGWGYRSGNCLHAPLSTAHRQASDRFTLLCGYTQMETDSQFAPMDEASLAAFGVHYAAFSGKLHDGFHRAGDSVYAYCGAFEGRSFDNAQEGGYVRIRAKRAEGGWKVNACRVPLDTYRYVCDRIDVSHFLRAEEAACLLQKHILEQGYGEKTVLKVVLVGSVSLDANFDGLEALRQYGVYSLWVEDRTVPTDGDGTLLQQMNAKGELYRHFYPLMTDGPEKERARAARAFRIGYAALSDEDFTKY